jgi:uncharacterized Tic20 family protein
MNVSEEIERLHRLHESGALTAEEFSAAKARLLNDQTGHNSTAESFSQTFTNTPPPIPNTIASAATNSASNSANNARQMAVMLHLSQYLGFCIPFAGWIVPILIWQLKKEEMPMLDAHGKAVANWLISSFIYGLIFFVMVFIIVGIPLLVILGLLCLLFPIIGAINAGNDEVWEYPMAIKFFK